ncbi:MAG: branched-chain amino acid ABC transporter permease [Deltaproteobacteria bacterium]|nr:branched-chain amino acid ABC transporter permease [Deltaproteobacteria bacterium]
MSRALRPLAYGVWAALLALPLMGPLRAALLGGVVLVMTLAFLGARALSRRPLGSALRQQAAGLGRAIRQQAAAIPRPLLAGLVGAGLLLFPHVASRYHIDVATLVGIYVVLALGLNVVVGLAGLLDLGYVAFYAVGAYAFAILGTRAEVSFWAALPIGAILAAIFGILLGIPVLRLRGDYLAIVTLGFGEMIRITLNNWDAFTNGPNGILNIPRPSVLGFALRDPMYHYYLILGLGLFTVWVIGRLNNSWVGRAWIAMREDELAAEAMGINVMRMKLLAFAMGATWAGFAGVFFASKQTFISPESFTFFESVIILSMVVFGGMGSIPGVILGAAILVILPEVMREFAFYRMLLFGGAMVLMMVLRPQGLLPNPRRKVELHPGEERLGAAA